MTTPRTSARSLQGGDRSERITTRKLREELLKLARQKPRYGYRRLLVLLSKCGQAKRRERSLLTKRTLGREDRSKKRHKILKAEANPAVTAIAHARPIPLPAPVNDADFVLQSF
jgi:hypothetical protein